MVAEDDSDDSLRGVAAGLAVLAGIAASDAACCAALGHRPRGDSHKDAVTILGSINADAKSAATALGRLINIKDQAHYESRVLHLDARFRFRVFRSACSSSEITVQVGRRSAGR